MCGPIEHKRRNWTAGQQGSKGRARKHSFEHAAERLVKRVETLDRRRAEFGLVYTPANTSKSLVISGAVKMRKRLEGILAVISVGGHGDASPRFGRTTANPWLM